MHEIVMDRMPKVEQKMARSKAQVYVEVDDGTMTRPVPLGKRIVGWPEHEISAINAARLAGASEEEIKALVKRLHEARPAYFAEVNAEIDRVLKKAG